MKWSDEYYPDLYCGCMEAAETACFEQNIIELWGDQVSIYIIITIIIITITTLIILTIRHYHHHHQGHYNENSDLKIRALTQQEILDNVNNNNVSGIFLKVLVVDLVVVFKE